MDTNETNQLTTETNLPPVLVSLLKGVIYQEDDTARWKTLFDLEAQVRDYFAVLGLDLIVDEAEGYAFLQSPPETDDEKSAIPRLIARRQLSFPVSLLLALLRKKLAEFDAAGSDTRLILSREEIIDLLRVFLPESSNEARIVDQVDRHISKVRELGFLRPLKTEDKQQPHYEVRRIIKSFIDAQWLAGLDEQLESYKNYLLDEQDTAHE